MNGNVAYLLHIISVPFLLKSAPPGGLVPYGSYGIPSSPVRYDEVLIVDAREVWKAGEGCWRLLGFRKENHGIFDTILPYTTTITILELYVMVSKGKSWTEKPYGFLDNENH